MAGSLAAPSYSSISKEISMSWGPAYALLIFDVIFFLNYGIGWFVTWVFAHTAITDNNITRIFWVYNICIGVDSFPARYVASCIWPVAFMFFGISVYLHWAKLHFDQGIPNWLGYPLLALSFVFALCFSLTYAVAPVGARDSLIHVVSFCVGLTGYALLKIYAVIEFAAHVGFKSKSWKDQVYVWSFLLQIFFMLFMSGYLIICLLEADLEHLIAKDVPDTIGVDYKGWVLVFWAAVGPPIQYMFANDELRHTVRLTDATP